MLVVSVGKRMVQLVLSYLPYTPHTIKTMKLHEYERLCNGEYKVVIKRGFVSKEQLSDAVVQLTHDFFIACNNIFYRQYIENECRVLEIKNRILLLGLARLTLLFNHGGEEKAFKEAGIPYIGDITKDLKTINSNLTLENNKLRWAEEEFSALKKRTTLSSPNDKVDYSDILINIQIGLQLGFRITSDITLAEYSAYLKQLEKIIERNGKSIEQLKRKE